MKYYSDYTSLVYRIDPQAFVKWLEGHGFLHVQAKRTDVWHGSRRDDGKFWVDVPLDRTLADYTEAMVRALGIAAEAEGLCIFEMLTQLIPSTIYVDRDMLVGLLGERDGFTREYLLELIGKSTVRYDFDSWNPWPATEPPENTKLRITIECLAGSVKCRDAVYLKKEPGTYTRFRYDGPGWYMMLTGKRIEDGKVLAWRSEAPYRKT